MSSPKKESPQKRQFLEIDGDKNPQKLVESLLKDKNEQIPKKPNFQSVEEMDKTFLLQRLEEFLPKIAAANEELSKLSEEELRERSCERTDGEYLMETNVLAADDMQDSPLFKVVDALFGNSSDPNESLSSGECSSSSSEEEEESDEDQIPIDRKKQTPAKDSFLQESICSASSSDTESDTENESDEDQIPIDRKKETRAKKDSFLQESISDSSDTENNSRNKLIQEVPDNDKC